MKLRHPVRRARSPNVLPGRSTSRHHPPAACCCLQTARANRRRTTRAEPQQSMHRQSRRELFLSYIPQLGEQRKRDNTVRIGCARYGAKTTEKFLGETQGNETRIKHQNRTACFEVCEQCVFRDGPRQYSESVFMRGKF